MKTIFKSLCAAFMMLAIMIFSDQNVGAVSIQQDEQKTAYTISCSGGIESVLLIKTYPFLLKDGGGPGAENKRPGKNELPANLNNDDPPQKDEKTKDDPLKKKAEQGKEKGPEANQVKENEPAAGVQNNNQPAENNYDQVYEQQPQQEPEATEEPAEETTAEETTVSSETTIVVSTAAKRPAASEKKSTQGQISGEGVSSSESESTEIKDNENTSKLNSGLMKGVTIISLLVFVILSGVFVVWLQKMI